MRQVKAGDTVRIKTAEELDKMCRAPSVWRQPDKAMIGTRQTVDSVFSNNGIIINGIKWRQDEYVLLPEIPERGDIVYVSNRSEKDAIENKEERFFVGYIGGHILPFLCVMDAYNEDYKSGKTFDTTGWKYAVKKPSLQKITKAELPAFLAEHGYELEG